MLSQQRNQVPKLQHAQQVHHVILFIYLVGCAGVAALSQQRSLVPKPQQAQHAQQAMQPTLELVPPAQRRKLVHDIDPKVIFYLNPEPYLSKPKTFSYSLNPSIIVPLKPSWTPWWSST